MATVNEKMTALANAIRTKSGATGALSIDGMITAVNGITTGGGTTYQLWGSHSLMACDFDVSRYAGTYNVSGIYTWFYDSNNTNTWRWGEIDKIVVRDNGEIAVSASWCETEKWYFPHYEGWADENELAWGDYRLLVYNIPIPITVSENLYKLFYALYDNGEWDYNVYQMGYDIGYTEGTTNGLEALDALCDWTAMVDSNSSLIMTLINYHPTYYMVCDIYYDGDMYSDFVVPPNDSRSYDWMEENGSVHFAETDMSFGVESVRWQANDI